MTDSPSEPSLIRRLFRVGSNGLSLLETHFRLMTVEAQEEALAWVRLAVLTGVAVGIAVFAFLLLNCALILLIGRLTGAWTLTVAGFGLCYLVAAGLLGWRVGKWWRGRPAPFTATQTELARTRQWLTDLWPPPSNPKN